MLLPPAAYGDLALALTIVALLSLVGSGPISNAVGRFYAVAHERGTLRCFFRATATLYGQYQLGAGFLALIGLLIYRAYIPTATWTSMGLAAIALSLVNGAGALLDAMQNAARHRLVVAWHQAAGQWLRLAGAVVYIHWRGATAANALSGYLGGSLLVFASQFLFFYLRMNPLAAGEPGRQNQPLALIATEMRRYSKPFLILAAVAWLQSSSDRWLLALWASPREVGLYQALNQVGYSPLIQLSILISSVVAPILFFHAGDGTDGGRMHRTRGRVRQLSWLMFVLTLFLSGSLLLVGKPLFALVVAPEYLSAARYLPLVALTGGLFVTGQMLTTDALVQLKSKLLMGPKIGSALLAMVFNYVGARAFGLPGVVWAGVATSSLYALWMVILTRRETAFVG